MSPLEKMARAMAEHDPTKLGGWHWTQYIPQARAALLAIREPDAALTEAGKGAASFYVSTYEEGLTPIQPVTGIVFTAMIDAILNQEPRP